jgi:hypothetical protein
MSRGLREWRELLQERVGLCLSAGGFVVRDLHSLIMEYYSVNRDEMLEPVLFYQPRECTNHSPNVAQACCSKEKKWYQINPERPVTFRFVVPPTLQVRFQIKPAWTIPFGLTNPVYDTNTITLNLRMGTFESRSGRGKFHEIDSRMNIGVANRENTYDDMEEENDTTGDEAGTESKSKGSKRKSKAIPATDDSPVKKLCTDAVARPFDTALPMMLSPLSVETNLWVEQQRVAQRIRRSKKKDSWYRNTKRSILRSFKIYQKLLTMKQVDIGLMMHVKKTTRSASVILSLLSSPKRAKIVSARCAMRRLNDPDPVVTLDDWNSQFSTIIFL